MCAPVMIGGCGSSGTTLVSHLMNASLSIHCGPELHLLDKRHFYLVPFRYSAHEFSKFLDRGVPTVGVLGHDLLASSTCISLNKSYAFVRNPENYCLTKEKVCDLAVSSRTFREFVDRLFRPALANSGKSRWAEKTPTNCYCIDEFLSLYSGGKYVHVVRDGRDVVASLMKRGLSAMEAVRRWIHDTASGLPHRARDRYHEIRYEDLVADPVGRLGHLLDFLGATDDPEDVIMRAQTQPVLENTHGTWTKQPNENITPACVGKWRRATGFGNRQHVERLFRYVVLSREVSEALALPKTYNGNEVLQEFGYDPSDHWNPSPGYGLGWIKRYLTEKICELLRSHPLYCTMSLWQPTRS